MFFSMWDAGSNFVQDMIPRVSAGFGVQDGLHQGKTVDLPYYRGIDFYVR